MWTSDGLSIMFECGNTNAPAAASAVTEFPVCPVLPPAFPAIVGTVRKGARVFLSDAEVLFCRGYGELRQTQNEAGGTYDMKYTKRSGGDLHVQGVHGELAVGKLLGADVYNDVCADVQRAHCRNNANDVKKDVEWQGLKIDVKCARHRAPFGLLVTANKRKAPADAYVLVIDHGGKELSFAGAALGTEVFKMSRQIRKWGSTYFSVPLAELGELHGGTVRECGPRKEECFFDLGGTKASWAGLRRKTESL